ncbi:MAG: type II toxin-antitoxin system VapC family toxin [Actinomycetota bacterium]|nr:type II toxin-antitoxin system VapC family toxin [Actinomycetota bacterium]
MIYLDSSALLKLLVLEPQSRSLERHLFGGSRYASCALARVEVVRAARRRSPVTAERAQPLLEPLELIVLDRPLLDVAADLEGDHLRSLDAIHVAAAQSLGDDLDELITYDRRMADAARALGLPVAAPA